MSHVLPSSHLFLRLAKDRDATFVGGETLIPALVPPGTREIIALFCLIYSFFLSTGAVRVKEKSITKSQTDRQGFAMAKITNVLIEVGNEILSGGQDGYYL